MPSSPFGLAYGLGAGIAGAQQQMQARQMAAQQMASQALQQQLLQHQVSQQQAEDEVGQTPIPQQMQSVPTYETQEQPNAYSAPGVPFGTGTIPQQVQTGTTQEPVKYTTPYQQRAYETAQRAQMVRARGFSFSADQLDQKAAQLEQQHQMMALQKAGMAFRAGTPNDAVPYLNSVGTNYKSIRESPDDPDTLEITRADGSVGTISRQQAELLAVNPEKAPEIEASVNFKQNENLYHQMLGQAAQTKANAAQTHAQGLNEHYVRRDAAAEKTYGMSYRYLTGPQKNTIWYSQLQGIPEKEAAKLFIPGASRNQVTAPQSIKALSDVNSLIYKKYGNGLPDPNSTDANERADYELYIKNMNQISTTAQEMADGRGGGATPRANPTHTPTTQHKLGPSGDPKKTPGGYLPGDYSRDGKSFLNPDTLKWEIVRHR